MSRALLRACTRGLIPLAVILASVAGIAYAAIPAGDGTISGCYNKQSGYLRVIDADAGGQCRPGESSLSWSERISPPDVFAVTKEQHILPPGGAIVEVARLRLSAGNYLVFAKANVRNRGGGPTEVSCWLTPAHADGSEGEVADLGADFGETILGDQNNSDPSMRFSWTTGMALTVLQELDATGAVRLSCRSSFNASGAFVNGIRVTATRVGTVVATELPSGFSR